MNFMQSHLMEKRMRYCRDASAAFSGDDCPWMTLFIKDCFLTKFKDLFWKRA
jgi:hypothetical protein